MNVRWLFCFRHDLRLSYGVAFACHQRSWTSAAVGIVAFMTPFQWQLLDKAPCKCRVVEHLPKQLFRHQVHVVR